MHICYVDESGCLGALPHARSAIQPVFTVTGVFIDQRKLPDLTRDFLRLKARYFPGLLPAGRRRNLDLILAEIKGNEIRRNAASESRRKWRHAVGFLLQLVRLLKHYEIRFVSRVWVKGIGREFKGNIYYARSIQDICAWFQNYLGQAGDSGMVIADGRRPVQNRNLSHSIFTQKFKLGGDAYPRVLEMPVFGDSKNHAGLQICDLVCSALIQPAAIHAYCRAHVQSVHIRANYGRIQENLGAELKALQHRFQQYGRWRGGVTVKDEIAARSGALLFSRAP